ncbi:MAG: MEKHLA domain-containing protein [Planctomycetota bacterium]|nr:MEKHLA domain-containing protein [Planctomycetota bacterium]
MDLQCVQRILDSFERWLGRDLVPRTGSTAEQADRLFRAPFVVVSHGVEPDPILCYGNALALQLWEMDAATFCRTPSRETAEPLHRDERARLLQATTLHGYVNNYQGIRISRTGKRFMIQGAIVWNVVTHSGKYHGQAATFSDYQPVDVK